MDYLEVAGGAKLSGKVKLCGAKNSILPLLAASLMTDGRSVIRNVPALSDVAMSCGLLSVLGIRYERKEDVVEIDGTMPQIVELPRELMIAMRGSFIFLGPLLARHKSVSMDLPGGCDLGVRPIDIHLHALGLMGAKFECTCCRVKASVPVNGLHGADISLRFPSVGATENVIMAAATADGVTTIENAAREPEIVDLARYLNCCGADIRGAGESRVEIHGVTELHGCDYTVIPDRILAATLCAAAVSTGSMIDICGIESESFDSMFKMFTACGVGLTYRGTDVTVDATGPIRNIPLVRCEPHPGFPTDAGPLLAVALCHGNGRSEIYDTVFERRFRFSCELNKFGADTADLGRTMGIEKTCHPYTGARVTAVDLRGGAALVCMALGAAGQSEIFGLTHIDRGYAAIETMFTALGANIRRKSI